MRILCFILILLTCISCDPEKPDSSVVLPTSLNTSFNIDEGFVEAQATAQGANFYSFMFYDNGDSTYVESTDGSASYNFATTGVYTIKSRAHVTPYDFIEKIDVLDISDVGYTGGVPTVGYSTPLSYPGYTLVWSDEFDGKNINYSNWGFDLGTGAPVFEDFSPSSSIFVPKEFPKDNFSVRWHGLLTPDHKCNYEIFLIADDGVRLFLNENKAFVVLVKPRASPLASIQSRNWSSLNSLIFNAPN